MQGGWISHHDEPAEWDALLGVTNDFIRRIWEHLKGIRLYVHQQGLDRL